MLVGGVLQGRELIEAAKRNSVIADVTKYQTALNTFKLQYNGALPGDFDEAEDYWGAVSGSCLTVASAGTQTCNGDGDGLIDIPSTNTTPPRSDSAHESWRAWQHLSNAEIVAGNFAGISLAGNCNNANYCGSPNYNMPSGSFSNSGFMITAFSWDADSQFYKNTLMFSTPSNSPPSYSNNYYGVSLTPKQQYSIDSKIDDGKPFKGRVKDWKLNSGHVVYSPNCTTDETDFDAGYRLALDDVACIMLIDLD